MKEYIFSRKHGKIHIKKYIGKGGKVTVPQFIDGFPVTKIGFLAFSNSEITEVIIPDGIRIIGTFSFYMCEKLKKITLQGRIDECAYAFTGSALEEISGAEYLSGCEALWTSFSRTPFYQNNETFIAGDKLVWCRKKSEVIHVPDYIKTIGYCAFWHSEAKKIILPEKLEKIESLAFFGSDICEIYIPDSVVKFGGNVLGCCKNLEKIRFPEDFGRREKWNCCTGIGMKHYLINDTQIYPDSDDDILIYKNVKCITVNHAYMTNPSRLRECQIFPEKLEYLKYAGVLADAKTNIFRNDTFRIENNENIFSKFMWRSANAGRRFKIIFDFNGVRAEILFWIPIIPYHTGSREYTEKSGLFEFYGKCITNADDGKFLDMNFYDDHILEQDIPKRIKAEIASERIRSNYRLTENAINNYTEYLKKT